MFDNDPWPLLCVEGIRSACNRQPGKIAVRMFEDGKNVRSVTYAELVSQMNRLSNAAINHWKLTKGDHIAICAANSIEFITLACGLGGLGLVVAKPNPKLSPNEIVSICKDADAKVIFCDDAMAQEFLQRDDLAGMRVISMQAELAEAMANAPDTPPAPELLADELAPFVLPYTSGTTGRPKGVQVTHRSRSLTFYGMGIEYGCFGPDDRFLGVAPMCHGAGFAFNLAPLYFGGTLDLFARVNAEQLLTHIGSENVTGVFLVPTHFQAIFALPDAALAKSQGHALKAIISNAAPLAQPMKERIIEHFGAGLLHECYGSTEAGIVTSMRPNDQLRKVQCVGKPFVNTRVKLLDDDGTEVTPGEVGELFSISPYLFAGYYNQPEASAASSKDGWVSAGDLARQDSEGYYYIVGRKKDMVISGGINIYPREIESVLESHVSVAECAVVGVPDDYWGEKLVAVIVPSSDEDVLDKEALSQWCSERISKQKRPKEFTFMRSLPRNAMGKILKQEVVHLLETNA